jgi:hypothetical protein
MLSPFLASQAPISFRRSTCSGAISPVGIGQRLARQAGATVDGTEGRGMDYDKIKRLRLGLRLRQERGELDYDKDEEIKIKITIEITPPSLSGMRGAGSG